MLAPAKKKIERLGPVAGDVDSIRHLRPLERLQCQLHVLRTVLDEKQIHRIVSVAGLEQRGTFAVQGSDGPEQLAQGNTEGVRELGNAFQGQVARAAFDVRHVGPVQIRALRQRLLRQAQTDPSAFDD